MTFSEQLNEYITIFECTAKELTETSGLSASVLSRYRSGSRVPETDSEQFYQLVQGLAAVAEQKGFAEYTEEYILKKLEDCIIEQTFPYEKFQENFNAVIKTFSVNVSDLAHYLNYDNSYISRIRNGQRKPASPQMFSRNAAKYIAAHLTSEDKTLLAELIGCTASQLGDNADIEEKLANWLSSGQLKQKDVVSPFLNKLEQFDLNEFMRSVKFDQLKVPSVPFQLPTSKNYYGIEEMRSATLDFFKTTVLSRSMEDMIAHDDTPMADKVSGTDFMKKYIFAVAMTLKKGLHIHFIHNINRPFEEMMMGLEGWIPMYMTGQISPYYIKGVHNKVFGHFLYSSGAAALSGEAIADHHHNGKMYLTNNKAELAYYRQRAMDILSKASPLMNIYRAESVKKFEQFVQQDCDTAGTRRSILSTLPIHTLSEDLLLQILNDNSVGEEERKKILDYVENQRQIYFNAMEKGVITEEIPVISEEEFRKHPIYLPLSDIFYEKDIEYSYQQYLLHREQTLHYSSEHQKYIIKQNLNYPFRNIQIRILEGKWAVISKNKAPAIHFVIHNPQLRSAIENMEITIEE